MKQRWHYFLSLGASILMIALWGCQDSKPKAELTRIEDVSYNPQTKTTLLTIRHRGGCNNSNYNYQYRVLNSEAKSKSIAFGLFLLARDQCQQRDLQFIRLPLPQAVFEPEQLIFQSSGNKTIVIDYSPEETTTISEIDLKPQQEIATIEDVNYNRQTQKIVLKFFLKNGCSDLKAYDYKVLVSDAQEKTATVALVSNIQKKCDFGDYSTAEMSLPQLPFKPEQLIFPISKSTNFISISSLLNIPDT